MNPELIVVLAIVIGIFVQLVVPFADPNKGKE
jgi:quinol-cytochrome oxidoreductase complex cytochrome b subunit